MRCMTMLRPGQDLILLPGGHNATRQAAEFYTMILGLNPDQVRVVTRVWWF